MYGCFGQANAVFAGEMRPPSLTVARKMSSTARSILGTSRLAACSAHDIDVNVAVAGMAEADDGQIVASGRSAGWNR